MKYWINKNVISENFVVLTDHSLLLGSSEEESIDENEKRLKNGDSPEAVFGSDNFEIIAFPQIFKVISRSTDTDIDLHYKVKKEEESKFIDFSDIDATKTFLNELQKHLPERLKKHEFQQSLLSASLPPLLSLLVALAATALFINKFRWLSIIIGGLWGTFSLYKLYARASNPPVITMWSSRGVIGNAWSHIKMAGSLGILALIVLSLSTRFPDSYGEDSFAQHMDQEELAATDVVELLENGGNINSLSRYGNRVLHYAIYHEDSELVEALLENGADPSLLSSSDYDALDEAVYSEQAELVSILLGKGKPEINLSGKLHSYVTSSIKPAAIALLFEHGADPSEVNEEGLNILQVAVSNYADYEMVSMLIENGVPVNVELEGLSLKQYASNNGQDDVAQLFGSRNVSFDRERELTEQIDAFYAKALNAQIEKASGIEKLILKSEGIEDDRSEMAMELSKSMQYKSLSAWGNHQVGAKYAKLCEDLGFDNAAEFSALTQERGQKIVSHARIATLIIERNRSIYNEEKNEFVVPSDYKQRLDRALSLVDDQFSSKTALELTNKCESVYKKLAKVKNK